MFIFLLIFAFLKEIEATCGPGCLQCDIYDVCHACDFVNFYVLDGGSCIKKEIPNCEKIGGNGNCIQCRGPMHYLDPTNKNCVSIPFSNMTLFCAEYSSNQECVRCETNYYLENKTCNFVTILVPNCLVQNSTSTCSLCMPNFYIAQSGQVCLPFATRDNCALYSSFECTRCGPSFALNENLYVKQFIPGVGSSPSVYFDFLSRFTTSRSLKSPPNVCEAKPRDNCSQIDIFGKCLACESGFALNDEGICEHITEQVYFCKHFLLPNVCIECVQGYHLTSTNTCTRITPITHCENYNQTANTSLCIKCVGSRFSIDGLYCMNRENIVKNCTTYDPNFDRCSVCETGFVLSEDGLYCASAVPNCTEYFFKTFTNSTPIVCTACSQSFYLNQTNNTCIHVNDSICLEFSPNTRNCVKCPNQYLLINHNCTFVPEIKNCSIYSNSTTNQCDNCNDLTLNTLVTNKCDQLQTISDCFIYENPDTCKHCNLGYYLRDTSTCIAIDAALNCLNYTRTACVQCKTDYYLTSAGTCRTVIGIYSTYCNATNITGSMMSQVEECSVCAENSVPVNWFEMYYCLETWYLSTTVTAAFDANCQNWRYNPTSNSYECKRCSGPNYLTGLATCGTTCTAAGQTTFYSYIVPTMPATNLMAYNTPLTVGSCGPTITNCKYGSVQVPQTSTTTTYVCTSCETAFLGRLSLATTNVGMFPFDSSYVPAAAYMPVIRRNIAVPELSCIVETTAGMTLLDLASNSTKLTSNCEYYYELPNWTANTACLKCNWGFTGRVVDYIANCDTFTASQCTKCRPFNHPTNSLVCYPVWPIPKCAAFEQTTAINSCTVCDNGYYLKPYTATPTANFCEASTVDAGCSIYSQTVDACVTCLATHFMVSGTCNALPTNCVTMVLDGGSVVCSVCDSAVSYIDGSNVCQTGSVMNCATYTSNANTCSVCENGFRLASATSCVAQPSNPSCQTHSQTVSGSCDTCNFNAFKFDVVQSCQPITAVADCQSYSTQTLCSKCNTGFLLASNMLSCGSISASLNCVQYEPLDLTGNGVVTADDHITGNTFLNSCTVCNTNYVRFSTTTAYTLATGGTGSTSVYTCVPYFSYLIQNCLGNNSGSTIFPGLSCTSGCSTGNTPVDWNGKNMCIEDAYLASLSSVVENCLVYDWDVVNSKFKCALCTDTYFLESNACSTTQCSGSNVLYLFKLTFDSTVLPSHFLISSQNFCSTISQNGVDSDCGIVAPEFIISSMRYACLSCKTSTNLKLIEFAEFLGIQTAWNFNSLSFVPNTQLTSPMYPYPAVSKCFANSPVVVPHGTPNASNLIDNCLYYADFTSGGTAAFGCIRCDFGFSGPVIQDAATGKGYIRTCTALSGCNSASRYTALQISSQTAHALGSLEAIFSCHECSSGSQIPVAFLQFDNISYKARNLLAYTIPNTSGNNLHANSAGSEGNHVICVDPSTPANIGMTAFTAVGNCALMVVNTNGGFDASAPSGTDFSKINAMCVACKSGFKPTFSTAGNLKHVVLSCAAIADCPAGTNLWLNSCSTCNVFGVYTGTNLVDYTTCTTNSISNCFVGTNTNCLACKNGFSLSNQNTCVQVQAPLCISNNKFSNDYLTLSGSATGYLIEDTQTPFFIHNFQVGCTSCAGVTDTSLVLVNTLTNTNVPKTVCATMTNFYVANASPFDTANCANYGFNPTGSISCLTCSSGYLLSNSYTCVSLTTYPNCAVFDSANTRCTACVSSDFVLVNYVCTSNSPTRIISNCAAYTAGTSSSSPASCETCDDLYAPDNTRQICSIFSQTTFPNCAQINFDQTACTKCSENYQISNVNGQWHCYPLGQIDPTNGLDWNNACLTLQNDLDPARSFQNYKLACTSCRTGFILTTANTYANYCYKFFLPESEVADCSGYYTTQPVLSNFNNKCISCAPVVTYYFNTGTSLCSTRTAVTNCATYDPNADSCLVCDTGYQGSGTLTCSMPYVPKNFLPNNIGYIESCSDMTTCNIATYYGGLEMPLSSLFSCHVCANTAQIPFAFISGGASFGGVTGLKEYAIASPSPSYPYREGVNGTAIQCIEPLNANFLVTTDLFVFPADCGLGIVNVDSIADSSQSSTASNVDSTKINVMCVACRPMFMKTTATAVGGATIPLMTPSCTAIPDCQSSSSFDSCDLCSPNFSLLYTVGTGISKTSCVSYSANPNCYATIGASGPCQLCKQGYYLNRDKYCELLNASNCQTAYNGFRGNQIEIQTMLALNPLSGCYECNTGYYSIFSHVSIDVCTLSPYITPPTSPTPVNYVQNCARYSSKIVFDRLICLACNTGFILTTENTCVAGLSNCFTALSSTQCAVCVEGFANIDNGCITGGITNCRIYVPYSTSTQICLHCKEKFALFENECRTGPISNCSVYSSIEHCTVCDSTSMLVKLPNYKTKCFPIPTELNCRVLDLHDFQRSNITCIECSENFGLVPLFPQDHYSLCYDFPKDSDCIRFDDQAFLFQSSFRCLQCKDTHFLSVAQDKCFSRTTSHGNCENFDHYADLCNLCKTGYQLTISRAACTSQVQHEPHCLKMDANSKCILCASPTYLQNGTCPFVNLTKQVPNCEYYNEHQICSKCYGSFFMNNGTCTLAIAKSCLTYSDISTCATCGIGFGLSESEGVTSCVFKNIRNCLESTSVYPFACITCEGGYFPNLNGTCDRVIRLIGQCKFYSYNSFCAVCHQGYILSSDFTRCMNRNELSVSIEQNCMSINFNADGVCTVCQPGYKLRNGICVPCFTGANQSCLVCDPNLETKCLICNFGYFQSEAGICQPMTPTYSFPSVSQRKLSSNSNKIFSAVLMGLILALF